MTKATTKEQAQKIWGALEMSIKGKPWFKRMKFSTDDNGFGIDITVDGAAYRAEGAKIGGVIEGVKVCVLMHG